MGRMQLEPRTIQRPDVPHPDLDIRVRFQKRWSEFLQALMWSSVAWDIRPEVIRTAPATMTHLALLNVACAATSRGELA